jgi:hypothetical protein
MGRDRKRVGDRIVSGKHDYELRGVGRAEDQVSARGLNKSTRLSDGSRCLREHPARRVAFHRVSVNGHGGRETPTADEFEAAGTAVAVLQLLADPASALPPKTSLEIRHAAGHSIPMSTKEIVQDLLQKLPEDVSLHDVAQEIEFVAAVRQGLAEIDRGERIPIEEIERELPSWVIR